MLIKESERLRKKCSRKPPAAFRPQKRESPIKMLANLLSESYAADLEESWENERTATLTRRFASRSDSRTRRVLGTPVRAFAVRLHETGYSLREATMILAGLGVERSSGAVWN